MNLNHHDSEEVVQQILLKLWQKLPEFEYDKRSRFRGWLCTVTGNGVKDFLRKQQSIKRKHDNSAEQKALCYTTPDIEKIAEQEWQNYISTLALERVKTQYSQKVIDIFLKLNNGCSRDQLAREYDLPPNTISVYKRRVINAMCKEIRLLEEDLS